MKFLKGFTLLELVIAVAIVSLLASIAMPLAQVTVQRGKEQDLRRSLREIREAIDSYKRAADDGVIERGADKTGYPPSLAALVDGVEDKRKPDSPKVYFMRRLPKDPFGNGAAPEWGLRSYASTHADPQKGEDVFDVYSLAEGTALNGSKYKEW